MRQRSPLLIVALLLILALYAVSFRLPAILFCYTASPVRPADAGAGHLVRLGAKMAFLSLFGPLLLNFAVLANPLLFTGGALLFLRRTRAAVRCLALAVLFALQTFQLLLFAIPEDEGGVMRSFMVHPLAGWYCWFGAILLALLLALAIRSAEGQDESRGELRDIADVTSIRAKTNPFVRRTLHQKGKGRIAQQCRARQRPPLLRGD